MFNEELEALQKSQHNQLYNSRQQLLEKEKLLMDKHMNEIEKHKFELERGIMNNFKPSRELLNNINVYNKLIKQARYEQADE
eukprot:CAMPEP_0116917878 /NCGR_PEP_ID=MMETSP0467-20121206/19422_1 /TAXON_ID=283647 /ORGANISM="Mesodinium pulex, Strain SPMC105" /LENGTH=81 /DNA_ID=CAMNT_0004595089 /DNA_START=228 /DNA_END=473 /DNA_ORIENTATION=-